MSDAHAPGLYRSELDLEGAERLVLRFPGADLTAIGSENGHVKLEIEIRGPQKALGFWAPSLRRVEGLLVISPGNETIEVMELRVRVPKAVTDLEIHNVSGEVDIHVPGIGLLVESESGRVRARGVDSAEVLSMAGDIEVLDVAHAELRSHSGKIACQGIAERLIAKSLSGDIEVEDSRGELTLETKSGEVAVSRPSGRVMIQTNSGDIEVETGGPFGGGDIATSTGHINLSLEGSDLELRAETLSGRLFLPDGEIGSAAGPRRCALVIGKGGRRFHAKSVSGDVEIEY
ncbi:MAG: DUF4097 family beta strand repeat-containing protein [Spirochaetota bacterium]